MITADQYREALQDLVTTARPSFPKTPYRAALDRARALLEAVEQEQDPTMRETKRQKDEATLKNANDKRPFPRTMLDHCGLAAYWGLEAAECVTAIDDGTSLNLDLDTEHAVRASRVAWYHAMKCHALRAERIQS